MRPRCGRGRDGDVTAGVKGCDRGHVGRDRDVPGVERRAPLLLLGGVGRREGREM